jgi:molybdopterin molybdotransferase
MEKCRGSGDHGLHARLGTAPAGEEVRMIPLARAQEIVSHRLGGRAPSRELRPLREASNRILAVDVPSPLDIPPFDRVAMDGYALAAGETASILPVAGEVRAGQVSELTVRPGTAVKIMTGAPAPPGTARVVPVELTREQNGVVEILDAAALAPGARLNLAPRGEDLRAGDVVAWAGERLDPVRLAALAACGVAEVEVTRQPRLALLATGDEVVGKLTERDRAGVLDANTPLLRGLLASFGYEAIVADRAAVPDDPVATAEALAQALDRADVVVLTGGVSAGDYDYVPRALGALGFEIHFSRVAIKPGKPTTFATGERGVVFGLPGNPVSVFVTCHLYLLPALALLEGATRRPRFLPVPLAEDLEVASSPRTQLLPAQLSPTGRAVVLPYHGSGHLQALTSAEGLIRVEPDLAHLPGGTILPFWPLRLGAYAEGKP